MKGLCLVCQREIQTLKDGTNRRHGRRNGCPGSLYRQARWPTGQLLRHHSGDLWEITNGWSPERFAGFPAGYEMRCLAGREKGREMHAHAEYLHRHGWTAALRSALDGCPDGGYCRHECSGRCFRVQCCEPLSNVFPDDRWPAEIREANRAVAA